LSIEEAIGIPRRNLRTSTLDAVACSSGIHSIRDAFPRANPGNLGRLQMETLESDSIENKGVPACKRIGALQFPIGDDVSYFHPLRSSVVLCRAARSKEAQLQQSISIDEHPALNVLKMPSSPSERAAH
jgi:hypothetical protein